MNEQQISTMAAPPAMPNMHDAFDALQEPINLFHRRANAVTYYARLVFDRDPDGSGRRFMHQVEVDALDAIVSDMRDAADAAEAIWTAHNNAWADAYAAALRCENRDPLLDLVRAYEAGCAAYNAISPIDEPDALAALTYVPAMAALKSVDVPAPTSRAGALAALRMIVREFSEVGMSEDMAAAVLPGVLAFFEAEAA